MSECGAILYEIDRGRARITLNRPEKRNALSLEMQQALHDALWEADADKRVHAVVLRGAGQDFCAGYDLSGWQKPANDSVGHQRGTDSIEDDIWRLERAQRLRMALFDMHKPVVAQVHGHCLAGGTDLALLCDMVIAADDAQIAFPPARDLGALPNQMWLYHAGPQWAKRLTLTGDTISGSDAAKIGLVMKSVPVDKLEAEVESLMNRFALIDPDLLAANKRIVNLGLELMGARTLQRLACENDARAHQAKSAKDFVQTVREHGLRHAFTERDAKFGDRRARVDRPDAD
jgi:enoyl-CoA hydratase